MLTLNADSIRTERTMPTVPIRRVLCLVTPVLLLAACGKKPAADAPAAPPPPAQVSAANIVIVDSAVVESGPSLSGTLVAERQAQLRAQIGGALLSLPVQEGSPVSAGQVVAVIDTFAIADQVRSARSMLRSAVASADVAKKNLERSQALHQAGAIADRDLEAARSQAAAADANVADAESRVAAAVKQLGNATLRAPFAGLVSEVNGSVGDVVQMGGNEPLVTIVDPSLLKLEASVPADQLEIVKVGSKVEFSVNGIADKTFTGRITRINPSVDAVTRQVRIYMQVPNADRALAAGLFASGRVATETARALAVPLSAIDLKAATPTVTRLRGGKVEAVPVTLGVRDDLTERTQVLSGVARGDTLLVGGVLSTPVGTTLRVLGRD